MSFYRKKKESTKLKSRKSGLEDLQPFDGSSMVLGEERPIRGIFLEEIWLPSYLTYDPGEMEDDPRAAEDGTGGRST